MTRRIGRYGRKFNRARSGMAMPGEVRKQSRKSKPKTPCPIGFTWVWHPVWDFWYCGNAKAA